MLGESAFTVLRRNDPVNVKGEMIEQAPLSLTYLGSIQPARDITLIRENFGDHIEAAIKIYMTDRLRTFEFDGAADVISYDGRSWEVVEVRQYAAIIPHFRVTAILAKGER